jgi:hypothetical protein
VGAALEAVLALNNYMSPNRGFKGAIEPGYSLRIPTEIRRQDRTP